MPVGALPETVAFTGIDGCHHQWMHQRVQRRVHAVEQLFHRCARLGAVGDAPGAGEGVDGQFAAIAEWVLALGAEQQLVVEGVPAGGIERTESQRAQLIVGDLRTGPVVVLALIELLVRECCQRR